MVKICVVGAGAVGLSTAINIQKDVPKARVTIMADRFDIDTCSDGAAGLFRPTLQHTPGTSKERFKEWLTNGFKHYSDLALSSLTAKSGCYISHGYMFTNTPFDALLKDVIFSFHELTTEQLERLKVPYKYGYLLVTCLVDCRKYLPWLTEKFKNDGGVVIRKTVSDLDDLVGEYDIIVNCTGFGSRELLKDNQVYPSRGQHMRMIAPWMKHFVYTDDLAFVVPVCENTVVGGTRQKGNFNKNIDPEDTVGILNRVKKLLPRMEDAKIEHVWVGLRPHRVPLRLESETLHTRKGPLKVVHNYGHGSNGIGLSWGTAVEASKLVKKLADSFPQSRL